MALSLNPLADPVKMSEKEAELETLKTEIQHLEIKIQKAKMAKKLQFIYCETMMHIDQKQLKL